MANVAKWYGHGLWFQNSRVRISSFAHWGLNLMVECHFCTVKVNGSTPLVSNIKFISFSGETVDTLVLETNAFCV